MWDRKELKASAKANLKRNYWKAVVASLVLMFATGSGGAASSSSVRSQSEAETNELATAIMGMDTEVLVAIIVGVLVMILIIGIISAVVSIFLLNPIKLGARKMLCDCRDDSINFGGIGYAFQNGYWNIVKIMFLKGLFIGLWSCLFVIPGIVKTYEYMMVEFIVIDNPGISSKEAFAKSKEMMTGNKWKAFVLDLSFLGWHIAAVCTCGIGEILFVAPYVFLTQVELYYTLKNSNQVVGQF